MLRRHLSLLRLGLFGLLALASLVRPWLIVACDLHAASHAHLSQLHDHSGDLDDTGSPPDGDAHGPHDSLTQSSLAAAADMVAPFELSMPRFERLALPDPPASSIAAHYAGAPFRPPIA